MAKNFSFKMSINVTFGCSFLERMVRSANVGSSGTSVSLTRLCANAVCVKRVMGECEQ